MQPSLLVPIPARCLRCYLRALRILFIEGQKIINDSKTVWTYLEDLNEVKNGYVYEIDEQLDLKKKKFWQPKFDNYNQAFVARNSNHQKILIRTHLYF